MVFEWYNSFLHVDFFIGVSLLVWGLGLQIWGKHELPSKMIGVPASQILVKKPSQVMKDFCADGELKSVSPAKT